MNGIGDGGPAFPRQHVVADANSNAFHQGCEGMSVRDYFAGQALSLGGEFFHSIDDAGDPPNEVAHCAAVAYAIADAMLKARHQ